MYIHRFKKWPHFTWDQEKLTPLLAKLRYQQGKLLGKMENLGFPLQAQATLQSLSDEILKSSEIEGEKLNTEQVRSSIAKRLGIPLKTSAQTNRHVDGIVEMLLDATSNHQAPLNKKRLFAWHAALFPTGYSGLQKIAVAKWRGKSSGAMQIVSGAIGHEKIHYEAPKFDRVEKEMKQFIAWFNAKSKNDPIVQAALAHFYFVTIHPFEDGNGRLARALSEMLLARSEQSSQRFYSMSRQIQKERRAYYNVLEECQKGSLDITLWIEWFLNCLQRAIENSDNILANILSKARFWETHQEASFNPRQGLMLNRLLDGFTGKLTSSKWAKIAKCSQDTALRDINDLLKLKVLKKEEGGGRSTSYILE